MTKRTDAAGAVAANGAFGPYLQAVPVNPLNNSAELTSSTSDTSKGWYYDQSNGTFKANDGKTVGGTATNPY